VTAGTDNPDVIYNPGRDALWGWFGLSYASFAVIPRVLMHAMPDEWQGKMAALLAEFDEAFPGKDRLPNSLVTAQEGRRFTKWPDQLLNCRHPDRAFIEEMRKP
jgi:hypothetical protein